MPTSVMWFRRDLRLGDNPALLEAVADGPVLPLFVLDPALWGPAGPSRRAYLGASLRALDGQLRQRGTRLSVVRGDPVRRVVLAAREVGAERVHVAADYGPYGQPPRPGGRGGARERRHRAGPHGLAVRRRSRPGRQRLRRPLPGLHAVQQGVVGPRLARPGRPAHRRELARARRDTADIPDPALPAGSSCPRPARPRRGGAGRSSSTGSTPTTRTATSPASTAPRTCRCT